MSDFMQFMKRIRVAIRDDDDDSERVPHAMVTLLFAKCDMLEDVDKRYAMAPDELRCCYVAVTSHLLEDAAKRSEMDVFTDVLSEKLAQVAFSLGTRTVDEITSKLAAHLERIRAADETQTEENATTDRLYEFGESARYLN